MKYYTIYKKFKHTCNAYLQNDTIDNCWYKPSPVFFFFGSAKWGVFSKENQIDLSHTYKNVNKDAANKSQAPESYPSPHLIFFQNV